MNVPVYVRWTVAAIVVLFFLSPSWGAFPFVVWVVAVLAICLIWGAFAFVVWVVAVLASCPIWSKVQKTGKDQS